MRHAQKVKSRSRKDHLQSALISATCGDRGVSGSPEAEHLRQDEKIRDSMRGPFESLTAQARQVQTEKKRFPHRFFAKPRRNQENAR